MRRVRFLFLVTAAAGCSVLTTFDIDGQPCDKSEPNPYLSCLSDAGYFCVDGVCKKGDPPFIDAGFKDAGFVDGGGKDGGTDGGNVGG